MNIKRLLTRLALRLRGKTPPAAVLPLHGYVDNRVASGYIETLPDAELSRLNTLLPWQCFTVDSQGRRFGNLAWRGKRDVPQPIPDARIVEMDRLFGLSGKSVLEVGCFEGVHTIALARTGARVTAIDSRIENVVKTLVRTNLFGCDAGVRLCDLDAKGGTEALPEVDFVHHVGVLYHLKDPVTHLRTLLGRTATGLLLDTHYATPDMARDEYHVDGRGWRYFRYREKGRDQVFAGMYDHARWLLLDDIRALLNEAGLIDIRITADSVQRNRTRVTLYAGRPGTLAN